MSKVVIVNLALKHYLIDFMSIKSGEIQIKI